MASRQGRLRLLAVIAPLILAAALPASSSAGGHGLPESKRVAIEGVDGPGPAAYDRVWVRKYGPTRPSCVLVMVPGGSGGQGGFAWIAQDIVDRVDGLAVWAQDRRSNAFEDTSAFVGGNAGDAYDYYLGGGAFGGNTFAPVTGEEAAFVREWGAPTTLRDLRQVVLEASERSGGCVILGGHSFGAVTVPAYAVWDFNGRPGFRDVDGLVLVDGGLFNAFENVLIDDFPEFKSVTEAEDRIEALQTQTPFGSDAGSGGPAWLVGVLPELVCDYALENPDAPSALQQNGFGNAILNEPPEFTVTNEAFAGLFNDQVFALDGARTGRLAESGDPRPWVDGIHTTIDRFCATFVQEPGNGMEWYFPIRFEIDLAQGMQQMRPTAITRFLGLRPAHLDRIDNPLYVIQTQLSDGGVLRAAHKLVRKSRIEDPTLIDGSNMRHFDPLMDVPAHNRFLKTVVPFLKQTIRGSHASRGKGS